jgi:hypothetical protein
MRTKIVFLFALPFLAFPQLTFAQGTKTGGIVGVVKDPSGAVIAHGRVEIINQATGLTERSLVTGNDGTYVADLLSPGQYRVQIVASSFKRYIVNDVAVRLAEVARADAILQVGASEQTVIVEGFSTLVNTENATMGQPLEANILTKIPLPTPNILFLLALSTGTAGEPGDVRAAGRGSMDINVNGQRTTNNSYSLEGVNVNDYNRAHFDFAPIPNPDAVQELKVATSLYDATSGSKGGGALEVVMRQGTRDLHWDVYYQNRNDAYNATEWFTKFNDSPTCTEYTLASTTCHKNRLAQNVIGGSISAPVPGLGGVIFGNYQALRARNGVDPNGSTSTPTVPIFPINPDGTTSAALLAAQFKIPVANIDPVAVNILNIKNSYWGGTFAVPRPGQGSCSTPGTASFHCNFSKIAPLSDNQFTISYDRSLFHDKQKLNVRWFYDDFSAFLPYGANTGSSNLSYPTTNPNHNKFLSLGHTTLISNKSLNEFKFGFSRFHFLQQPQDLINLSDIGATRPNAGQIPGMYQVSISGLFTLGVGSNDDQGVVSNTFYWSDTWSHSFNRHNLRVGTEISRYQLNRFNRFVQRGVVTLGGTASPSFTAFQNFLQGRATQLQVASGDPARYFRSKDIAFFAQDDFRVSPRFTLNLGLRWEGMGYSNEKQNRMATYLEERAAAGLNPFAIPKDLNLPGTSMGRVPDCMARTCFDTNNWAPRIGFAWDIFGDKKTVLRGGYGIYYQRISNQTVLQTSLAPPFTVQALDTRIDGNPGLVLANPWSTFPALVPPQQSFFAGVSGNINTTGFPLFVNETGQYCGPNYAPSTVPVAARATNCSISTASFTVPPQGFNTPYNQQWNLTIERDLFHGWALEAGYVGAHYVGGIGIYNPFVRVVTPGNPITVKDINGNSYTITTNTPNNEPLRYTHIGLSRSAGARYAGNIGFALYDAAQATLSHRFQHGLFFQAGYTFSKTIDNVSGALGQDELNQTRNGQGGANMTNLANINPALGRAIGDFDRRHRLVVTYAYDLPLPKSGIWGTQVFQGWTISGSTFFQSGLPFSVTSTSSGGAYASAGVNTPDLICNANQSAAFPTCMPGAPTTVAQAYMRGSTQRNVNNFLNPNMFSNPVPAPASVMSATLYGNTPRNAFRGPLQQDWDIAVNKSFRLAERHTLSFRTAFFNAFNHPAFRAPALVNLASPSSFGLINNTVIPARLIQFDLKYEH